MATNNSSNNKLGPSNSLVMTSNGAMLLAQQPSFFAYNSNAINGVTGDGTTYQIIYDTVVYDKASNYNNTTGVFTASETGVYEFSATTTIGPVSSGSLSNTSYFFVRLVTTNNVITLVQFSPNADAIGTFGLGLNGTARCFMNSGNVAAIQIIVNNGIPGSVGVAGNTSPILTFFSGGLCN